jgi:Zinc dependent phospholipase C
MPEGIVNLSYLKAYRGQLAAYKLLIVGFNTTWFRSKNEPIPFKLTIPPSIIATLLLLLLGFSRKVQAYSVLSHEALIDAAWEMSIRPLLVKRFPNAADTEMREAHGFAYGGSIIQDIGYYPHGSHFFRDLLHYVRGGDFITAMIRDSRDLNEYAFALGSLAHYAADNNGHRIAVNLAVPMLYPKLQKQYRNVVTYEDDPSAHLRVEFGFDVLQVAKGRYPPDAYHNFIGFGVSKGLLERAFQDEYSLPLRAVFTDFDRAVGSYRYSVSTLIPKATRIAWQIKKDEIQRDVPGTTLRKFQYNLSQASFEKEWGKNYDKPSVWEKFLAFLIRVTPKIGPLKVLAFRTPTPEMERMFMDSFNVALAEYRRLLAEVKEDRLNLPNRNFDTGSPIQPGTYFMQDDAYARLLHLLAKDQFRQISPALRSDILAYFAALRLPANIKRDNKDKTRVDWKKVPAEIQQLHVAQPEPARAQTSDLSCYEMAKSERCLVESSLQD